MTPMLAGLTWLLVFQSAGEVLALATGAPVPGPVVGLVLLRVALRLRVTAATRRPTLRWASRPTGSRGTCRCCSCRRASA